jgi:hypothetical protein
MPLVDTQPGHRGVAPSGWFDSVEASLEHALRLLLDAYTRDLTGRRHDSSDETTKAGDPRARTPATVRWFSASAPTD